MSRTQLISDILTPQCFPESPKRLASLSRLVDNLHQGMTALMINSQPALSRLSAQRPALSSVTPTSGTSLVCECIRVNPHRPRPPLRSAQEPWCPLESTRRSGESSPLVAFPPLSLTDDSFE